ncbi:unnamed protein product [Closterium sp. NIES-65]|nr:unnamed protein product [Closterium sp. NIES-65]
MTSSLSVALHGGGRVLSIQSHTVQVPHSGVSQAPISGVSQAPLSGVSQVPLSGAHPRCLSNVSQGYVGNKAAVFPLQLLGFDVDPINSVQLSNHTGYPTWKGQILDGEQLWALIEGLEANGLLFYTHLLTGYIGSLSFLKTVLRVVEKLRSVNPNLIYVCDPVMGDDGRLYIRPELVPIYRHQVVPVATLITPNQFEAEQLTGLSIRTQADAITACDMLHAAGPRKQRSQLVMAEGIGFAWARPSLKPAPSLSTAFNHSVQVVITSMEVDGRLLVVGSDASSPAGEEVSEVRRHEGICLVVEVCFESPGVQPLNHICLA